MLLGKFEELVVILLIVLVLFGGKKVPELARAIGRSAKEVREGFAGETKESITTAAKKKA